MTRFNHAEAINELQELRTTNERCCERVVSLAQRIIDDNYTSTLGDQGIFDKTRIYMYSLLSLPVWPFYEQAAIAALDTQNFTLANVSCFFF